MLKRNVFICNDDQIKLGDFGVARKVYVDPDEEGGVQILFGTDIWFIFFFII